MTKFLNREVSNIDFFSFGNTREIINSEINVVSKFTKN